MEQSKSKIEQAKLSMMLRRILDLEEKNNKTKEKKDTEVVSEIISIIIEECK